MPYKISGNVASESRILVIKETDYSIESSTVETGAYEIESLDDSNKLILARNVSTGEAEGYGLITPEYYDNTPVNGTYYITSVAGDFYTRDSAGWYDYLNNTSTDMRPNGHYKGSLGLSFSNVTIPQGATINSAQVQLWGSGNLTYQYTNSVIIRAHDVDNSYNLTTFLAFESTVKTSAGVSWSYPTMGQGGNYYTSDILSVIQEVVNRPGWSSGNMLTILFLYNSGAGERRVAGYNNASYPAPRLHVTYVAP
jgi:hypothetical protein